MWKLIDKMDWMKGNQPLSVPDMFLKDKHCIEDNILILDSKKHTWIDFQMKNLPMKNVWWKTHIKSYFETPFILI